VEAGAGKDSRRELAYAIRQETVQKSNCCARELLARFTLGA